MKLAITIRWVGLALILATLVTLGVVSIGWYDVAVVQKLTSWTWLQRGDIGRTVALCEGYGVLPMMALMLLGLAILIPETRRRMPQVVTAVLLAGAISHIFKFLITRERPHHFLSRIAETLSENADAASTSTWHGLLRVDLGLFNSVYSSFPSGHTTVAAALTAMLWAMFPQIAARIYFTALLFLLGLQRVVSQAHYPSDVLFGAALGIAVATTIQHTPLSRWKRLFLFWRVRDGDKVIRTTPIPNPRDLAK